MWIGGSLVDPAVDRTYETRYAPTFGTGAVESSSAGQTLTLDGRPGRGGEVGVGWYPDRRWGVRVSVAWSAGDVGGANAPYAWSARFIALQPPDFQPRTVDVAREIDWPDTTGRLRLRTVAVGGSRQWARRRVAALVSGGIGWVRVSGEMRRLGWTSFHLGGHSTFFAEEFQVEAALKPATVAAVHGSADIDVTLARHCALRFGYRYVRAARASLRAEVTSVVNADQILIDEPLSRIEADLALDPVRIAPSSSQLLVALVLRR